jgi:hypothetical protein
MKLFWETKMFHHIDRQCPFNKVLVNMCFKNCILQNGGHQVVLNLNRVRVRLGYRHFGVVRECGTPPIVIFDCSITSLFFKWILLIFTLLVEVKTLNWSVWSKRACVCALIWLIKTRPINYSLSDQMTWYLQHRYINGACTGWHHKNISVRMRKHMCLNLTG